VWGADGDIAGFEHRTDRLPPDVGHPNDHPTDDELMAGRTDVTRHPFWSNLEQRPLDWIVDWDTRMPSEPERQAWYKFVPTATFDDPWVDAARTLILIDLDSWPTVILAHTGELEHYAPTIELNARFIGDSRDDPWLLGRARAPVAANGLVAASAEIWTIDQRLVAIGGSTLLCRPATRRPDR
jgi:acyl-CoA thioesterase-2